MERTASRRTSVTIRNVRFASLFTPEDILPNLGSLPEEGIVRRLLEHLALEYGIGNVRSAYDEVIANMDKGDMFSNPGMAILHARLEKVSEPLVAMAPFRDGGHFFGKKIYLLVVVLSPLDMPGAYKQILHGLNETLEDKEAVVRVASLGSPLAVWQHFDSGGQRLPDHLQARHIMSEVTVFLNGDDSLAKAIDLFLAHKVSELPVLTPDRDLIGVVTTRQLVKVCLPDYLMWMEDMTPFLNFEPIAEIIRNESSTWLREIMALNYAHVVEDSPAILALKEIGRRDTDNAYVLRERQLMGVIYLHQFLSSVLR